MAPLPRGDRASLYTRRGMHKGGRGVQRLPRVRMGGTVRPHMGRMVFPIGNPQCARMVLVSLASSSFCRVCLLVMLVGCFSPALAAPPPAPRVAIFVGLPGDAERTERYLATVKTLREALIHHAHVPAADVAVLFGEGKPSPYRECSTHTIARELDGLRHKSRDRRPVWIFVLGHANTAKDKVFLNVKGKDMEIREFAGRLDRLPHYTPQVVVLTTAASGNCLAPLAATNRCVLVATQPGAEDNETEFPHILANVLAAAPTHDANADGKLSVIELMGGVRRGVKAWYAEQRLMPTETPLVDADGDGKPATAGSEDERRAELFALWLNTERGQ